MGAKKEGADDAFFQFVVVGSAAWRRSWFYEVVLLKAWWFHYNHFSLGHRTYYH
jgi:hypothetical protein